MHEHGEKFHYTATQYNEVLKALLEELPKALEGTCPGCLIAEFQGTRGILQRDLSRVFERFR